MLQDVKEYFSKFNFTLYSSEYINSETNMKYICNICNLEGKISYNLFRIKNDNWKCENCKVIKFRKEMFEKIKKEFEDADCELLENEYINNRTKLCYKCKCGNIAELTYNSFQSGKRCMECSGNKKLTIEFLKEQFQKNNCVLLSTEYVGCDDKLKYICECKNESEMSWSNFKKGHRCRKCRSYFVKHTIESVKEYFQQFNYTLLEKEYINCETKMKYKCNKNHRSKISFHSFQNGCRCGKCFNKTEQIVNDFLEDTYENVIPQAKFNWCKNINCLPFDFLLDDYKLLLEIDGGQHFKQVRNWKSPEETQERDIYKMKLAIEHGYSIIRIFQEDIFNNAIDWKELLEKNIKKYKKPKIIYISKDNDLYNDHKELYKSNVV